MDKTGKINKKRLDDDSEDSYYEVQLEDIITQAKPEDQISRSSLSIYSFVKFLHSFCSCLKVSTKKPQKITEKFVLLPPKDFQSKIAKTLVLDLDETLVHSSLKPVNNPDMVIQIEVEGITSLIYVKIRPGVSEFLAKVSRLYEIVLFTASLSKYANPVINKLDPDNYISSRLFRENCVIYNGNYVKNLSQLGRNVKDVVIVDNSPIAYSMHPNNAVPIKSWFDDEYDKELGKIIPILESLSRVEDIPSVIQDLNQRKIKLSPKNILNLPKTVQQQVELSGPKTYREEERSFFNSPMYKSTSEKVFRFETN
ncbi:unnamed protein product [Blepharisma stoltei]|uniref:FCP1 homology domain-containing protein n=1 Tax=Blepharisma stoltei TaxID=1481888 RepID=A0AAU9JP71_9CILI|nr:unnamed protein product [Blepharisma stoltei]